MELQKTVFMVMPFGNDVANQVYINVVKPLCAELKFDVVRVDEITSTEIIYNDIMQGIKNSEIIIVDISGKNPNVMYELGIAHSLRQQTTVMITQDSVSESPFDIAHFRIIGYTNTIEGCKKLEESLRKTIETIQCNHKLISQHEFEYCLKLYTSLDKKK
jgi:hypothetical protein